MTVTDLTKGTAVATLRILLADDHPLVLAGLTSLLGLEADLEVVGTAKDGLQAVQLTKSLQPDLVIMDLQMPRLDGLGALEAIREQLPETKVLILTSMDDEQTLFRVIRAGGHGYVLKKAAEEELLTAIRDVQAGKAFVRPSVTQMLVTDYAERVEAGEERDSYEQLTQREREILSLLAQGMTNRQIAEDLVISIRTVETHRSHITDKLGFKDRASLVRYAARKGYLA